MKKALKIAKQVLFYIFIIYAFSYLAIQTFAPSYTMDFFGYRTFVVVSDSMEPDINRGDMIIVIKVKEEDLKIDDAITFYTYLRIIGKYDYVTHYIVDIESNLNDDIIYITQGVDQPIDRWTDEDNNPIDITYDDITGRVLFTIPILGQLLFALRNPILLLLILVNIIIIYVIIKLIKAQKKVTS